jgi:hypothetical protein
LLVPTCIEQRWSENARNMETRALDDAGFIAITVVVLLY